MRAWLVPWMAQASCAECLAARGGTKDSATTKQLVHLLSTPLDDLPGGVETVLRLEHYAVLMAHLDFDTNRQMAVRTVTSVIKHSTKISTTAEVGIQAHRQYCLSATGL